ncbi:pilus assembly protein TadG-related protein [Henriciella sp. AS95]|uniref:pilus assembly protein TadG-related protein n=1 Tax=Henriciella sp. AS95 TaxID=3135782 RepID=UPI0031807BEE
MLSLPSLPYVRFCRKLADDLSGQVVIIVSMMAPIIVLMAAFAVDIGATSEQKRRLQGLADIAAIAAAANVDDAEKAVYTLLADNNFGSLDTETLRNQAESHRQLALEGYDNRISVELGRYVPDQELAYSVRFVPGGEPVNAVRVSLKDAPARYFDFLGEGGTAISVSGTATVSSQVAMSIGSRLVSLEGGLVNALLSGLTGSEVSLSAMDYNALLDADVDLLQFSDALASNLDLTAVNYDDVLESDVSLAQVFDAMADVSDGSARAKTVLRELAGDDAMADLTVPLAQLYDFGPLGRAELGSVDGDMDLDLDAVEMLTASAIAANGDNQVDLDLGASVPGLVDTRISLLVGERPQSASWFSLTDDGSSMVSTAQLRLFIDTSVSAGSLLGGDLVRLPLYIELASAEARIVDVICTDNNTQVQRVDVEVQPSIMTLQIADLKDGLVALNEDQELKQARLLNARLIEVRGSSRTSLSSPNARTLRFHEWDIGGDPKTVETREALRGAIASTIGTMNYDIDVAGLSLTTPTTVEGLVNSTLQSAAGPVDSIVESLTSMLGIGLGEADVWVHHARCNRSVLVQ